MSFHEHITPAQADLIRTSRVFFVASADPKLGPGPDGEGPVNLSPKGAVPLHVLDERTVAYLDFPGSGNETSRHASLGGPVTVMVMSMSDTDAAIVRLYGRATIEEFGPSPWTERLADSPPDVTAPIRQIVRIDVERTQTSCGYGVPVFEYVGARQREQRGRRFQGVKGGAPKA